MFGSDRYSSYILVGGMLTVLFFAYAYLAFFGTDKFTSPDETANFYFTKQFADHGKLTGEILEDASPLLGPRSMANHEGILTPVSFLGLPLLYGAIVKIIGDWSILFLTPLLSVIAVFVFYRFIQMIFDQRIAFISAILFAAHPAFWYYSARGMFHNALFLDLLIFGFYFVAQIFLNQTTENKRRLLNYALAGLFIGFALSVRTSEVAWVALVLLFLAVAFRKRIDWRGGVWVGAGAFVLAFLPIFIMNQHLYGNPLTFAYTIETGNASDPENSAPVSAWSAMAALFPKVIFPFGIDWEHIARNVWYFGVTVVWPFAVLAIFGLLLFVKTRVWQWWSDLKDRGPHPRSAIDAPTVYAALYLIVSAFLIIYYGSWLISDSPLDPAVISIEQSYARYWLPVYVFGMPLAGYLLVFIFDRLKFHRRDPAIIVLMCGFALFSLCLYSLSVVLSQPNVGLAKLSKNVIEYKSVVEKTRQIAGEDAVILAGRFDKIFFPDFPVISTAIDTSEKATELRHMISRRPTYAYVLDFGILNEEAEHIKRFGFQLTQPVRITNSAILYRVEK